MRLGDEKNGGERATDSMVGEQIGPLRLLRNLGSRGGDSREGVYLAEHVVLKTRRVVRVLPPQLTDRPAQLERLLHDARAAARLRHRNLIGVHDLGRLASGAWYLALDYLDGRTLARFVRSHARPLEPALVLHVICQIANGLHLAHGQGIVHRDVRPENVFLIARDTDPQHAVLLGFGLARSEAAPCVYLAPEQLRGGRETPATDVFALAVMAYEMITGGSFPYQRDETAAQFLEIPKKVLRRRYAVGRPVDLRERVLGALPAWASLLQAAVDPDPARRPPSIAALAVLMARSLPEIAGMPDGRTIVRAYAPELLDAYVPAQPSEPSASPRAAPEPPRYQIGRLIGAGGMAEVFEGTTLGAEGFVRRVAIKRVLTGLSHAPEFAAMFVAEAKTVSRFSHPNIVHVLDFHRDAEGRFLLVMEYVDGTDLATLLRPGPIAPSLAVYIAVELLRGLGYAHALADPERGTLGVVHRDVSPQNLLLDYQGAVKVSDFGLARAVEAGRRALSMTLRGKPSYMSPEQVLGLALDGRSDLFAVGVVLWEMLTSAELFSGCGREILGQVAYRTISAPRGRNSVIPAALEAVVMKLVAQEPDARYATAEEAIEALLHCGAMPIDGRGELARAMAERVPRAGAPRLYRPVTPANPDEPQQPAPSTVTSCSSDESDPDNCGRE